MKYSINDFIIPNIANVPCTKDRIIKTIKLFENRSYEIKDIIDEKWNEKLGITSETLRKAINHSKILGIIENNEGVYSLAKISKEFYFKEERIDNYILKVIESNQEIETVCNIIMTLLSIFPNSLKYKTLYSIFSLIGKNRLDSSSIQTVGRNLRPIISILSLSGAIKKENSNIVISKTKKSGFKIKNIKSIEDYYMSDIVITRNISIYLEEYFEKNIVENILRCLATYETTNYIWAKSSLYKDMGEIENLYGEFIMTVMKKGNENR
ncbi:hypothetical protein KPL47_02310 [Clostridium estertheticum]|uniref:hypothetical protein n=1 Tax=Clostridium estertheticum TaxID=238834 RepID=UPI001C0E1496|nr:hypothetical protein [Clostridium estertheticum]MBU3175196.1 hypothetical protein [Clostridium estertheticum]